MGRSEYSAETDTHAIVGASASQSRAISAALDEAPMASVPTLKLACRSSFVFKVGRLEKPTTDVAISRAKRAMDIVFALVAIFLFAPLMLVLGVLVAITSPGPVLFRQNRTGLGGRTFRILKFRSMTVQENGATVRQACRNDARVTRLGLFLRMSSLDELPQLFNVLKGDMSLVGPRPHAIAHDLYYAELLPNYSQRFLAKPGITGLAQISGLRGEIHDLSYMDRRVKADCAYIEGWSLRRDLGILIQTLPRMIRDQAAY